jgi:translation initiation factor 4E
MNTKNKYNDIQLGTKWNIYDHVKCDKNDYETTTNLLCSFSTVFEFWQIYDNIPKPSSFFFQKETGKPYYIKNNKKREISSISVFRDGIYPKWEDPMNKKGGSLEYRLKESSSEIIDKLWLYLCTYCFSEQLSEKITGFRLVDSSQTIQQRPLYRIELWISDISEEKNIENKFRKIFEIDSNDKIFFKKHNV